MTNQENSTASLILQKAYQLFISQGYHATSMRHIAKECHIALSSIYNHFANKEDLFRHVFFTFHPYHDVLPFLENTNSNTPEEFIHNALMHAIDALDRRPGFLNLMFIEIVEFNGQHIRELAEALIPRGVKIAERITKQYPTHFKSIPPLIFIRSIIAFIFGFYVTDALVTPLNYQTNRHTAIRTLIDIFCHGVLNDNQEQQNPL